jgi:hypothetical protein
MPILSCDEPVVTQKEPECLTVLLGDKDGFGMGLLEGSPFVLPAGTALPVDNRSSTDPRFTDIYPADMASSAIPTHLLNYVFDFAKPTQSITSVTLKFMTIGIQDGDGQVSGSDTDIKLYLDNMEQSNAFDGIDQFDFIDGSWSEFASNHEIEIPSDFLNSFNDGKVEIRMEILQLNPNPQSYDGFAIDYCELEICLGGVQH